MTRPDQVEELVERLEVHYLANPDGDLHFALVSDWRDAEGPELADDAELLGCGGPRRASDSMRDTDRGREGRIGSCSSIAGVCSIPARNSTWAGSASGASFTNSTVFSGEPPTPASSEPTGRQQEFVM